MQEIRTVIRRGGGGFYSERLTHPVGFSEELCEYAVDPLVARVVAEHVG